MNKQLVKLPNVQKKRSAISFSIAAFLVAMAATAPVLAQDEGAQSSVTDTVQLDTITVQARFADEAIADVPFSVTAIKGEEIEKKRLPTLQKALAQSPGVDVMSYGTNHDSFVRIRGVGSLGRASLDDNSVVIHMDGMPQSMMSATLDMMDIESVEILKGPQGTLFGRGSEGGAIIIQSRRPTRELEGYIGAEYGTEMQRMVTGALSGPISETLSGRAAFKYWGADGIITNTFDGKPATMPENYSVRGTLLWQPSAKTDLTLIAGHEIKQGGETFMVLRPYDSNPQEYVPPPFNRDNDRNATRLSAELEHDLGFAKFTSVTGYSKTDAEYNINYSPLAMQKQYGFIADSYNTTEIKEDLFNQEFRLSSRPGDRIFWVAGANYYQTNRSVLWSDLVEDFFPVSPFNSDVDANFEVKSYSLFGEITYPLTDKLKITGGLRRTWDDKSYDAVWTAASTHPLFGTVNTDAQTLKFNYTTGRAALNYELVEGLNIYGIYARGYKAGGWFDQVGSSLALGLPEPTYKEAITDSYELGFKSQSPDGSFRLSGAVFFNETTDDHLAVFDSATFSAITENFDTESRGAELELAWQIGGGFSFSGGLAYTDATITKVPTTSLTSATAGDRVPGTPEWSATLSLTHEADLPSFLGMTNPQLVSTITNRYVGERAADVGENFTFASYNKLDARVGLKNGSTEFYLWGENLLDKYYDGGTSFYYPAVSPPFGTGLDAEMGAPARGRTFGIGLMHKF